MGMSLKDIRDLIRLVNKTDFQEVEIEQEGTRLVLKKAKDQAEPIVQPVAQPIAQPIAAPAIQTASAPSSPVEQTQETSASDQKEEDANLHKIVSPMVGTFYRAPAPDADPYVKEGDQVDENTVVCIIEAMKLMNEIEAEVKGTIEKILVENGQLVEYGQPLFLVRTT